MLNPTMLKPGPRTPQAAGLMEGKQTRGGNHNVGLEEILSTVGRVGKVRILSGQILSAPVC